MKTIQIDKAVLQSLYGENLDCLNEVFSEFLSIHAEIKQNLVSSYETGEFNSLKKLLHYHGPSFMYVGMPDVSSLFKQLELQCKSASEHHSMETDFSLLIEMIDESRRLVIAEMSHLESA
ncbi:MAG: hypothetical protein ACXWWC_08485 [Chitinophagaceae bacterium]